MTSIMNPVRGSYTFRMWWHIEPQMIPSIDQKPQIHHISQFIRSYPAMSLSIAHDPCPRIYKCMAGVSLVALILLGTPKGLMTKRGQVCIQWVKLTRGLPSDTLEKGRRGLD